MQSTTLIITTLTVAILFTLYSIWAIRREYLEEKFLLEIELEMLQEEEQDRKERENLEFFSPILPENLIIEVYFQKAFFEKQKQVRPFKITPPQLVSWLFKNPIYFGQVHSLNYSSLRITQNKLFHSDSYHIYVKDLSIVSIFTKSKIQRSSLPAPDLEVFLYQFLVFAEAANPERTFEPSFFKELREEVVIRYESTSLSLADWIEEEKKKKYLLYKTTYSTKINDKKLIG